MIINAPRLRISRLPALPALLFALVALQALSVGSVAAQDPNLCDEAGDAPDVVVFDLLPAASWGRVGDIHAFSVGTESCNVGTCWLNW